MFSAFYVSKIQKTVFCPIEHIGMPTGLILFFSSWHLRRLGRDRLREESFMLPTKNKAKHTFTCSPVASLAFPLQRYCGLPTRKAKASCLRKFSSPCGVVIPGQALL